MAHAVMHINAKKVDRILSKNVTVGSRSKEDIPSTKHYEVMNKRRI